MLEKVDSKKDKQWQLLDVKKKRRFNEACFVKNIATQGDALQITIQAQVPITTYSTPFYGIWPFVCHHNMKVAMERRKAKLARVNGYGLQLVNPPRVYKPMPHSMPILWVIKLRQVYLAQKNIITSCRYYFCHHNLNVHHQFQKNFSSQCQEKISWNKGIM